jgi:hypothetical protein
VGRGGVGPKPPSGGFDLATQALAEADHTIEDFPKVCFEVGVYQLAYCVAVSAVWRLGSTVTFVGIQS